MQLNKKLSCVAMKIGSILDSDNVDEFEQLEILMQILIKLFLYRFKNDKDSFFEVLGEMYDALEEMGNTTGYLPKD